MRKPGFAKVLLLSLAAFGLALGGTALLLRDRVAYLSQAAMGQATLLFTGQPIAELLARPELESGLKKKLQLVQEVKQFAEAKLGLKPTHNYQKFVDVKRDYLVMVLSASPPLKFEAHTWWFPIVGTVPYLGFFDLGQARRAEKALQAKGLETHLRGSSAYSTLGWFKDPLLSTMLQGDEFYLVNTVIHESTHATLFIPGQVTFNENLATFVGNKGTFIYYAHRYGQGSPQYQAAENLIHDQKIFNAFLDRLYRELDAIYRSDRFDSGKEEAKAAKIAELKREYQEKVSPQYRSGGYRRFAQQEWNNAMILAYKAYYQDLEKFEQLYQQQGQDIGKLMRYVQERKDTIVKEL